MEKGFLRIILTGVYLHTCRLYCGFPVRRGTSSVPSAEAVTGEGLRNAYSGETPT